MTDLAWFLLARIDERRAEAERLRELGDRIGQKYGHSEPPEDDLNLGDLAYFAMHREADRVLAECEANRRIVSLAEPVEGSPSLYDAAIGHVLQLLALLYADHPDYWQEWKPEPGAWTTRRERTDDMNETAYDSLR